MKRLKQRKIRSDLAFLPSFLLLVAFLTINVATSCASVSIPKEIGHNLPPKSSEFEISTFSFSGLLTRNEIPSFSITISCKLLSHHVLQKLYFCKSINRNRIIKSLNIIDIFAAQRLSRDFYTLAVGCLRL